MATNGRTIKSQSNEGDIFDVDVIWIEQSELLKGFSDNGEDCTIPLENINSTTLKKVIEWMNYHKNDILQSEKHDDDTSERTTRELSAWDRNFMKVDSASLFELVLAANYLNMKSLLNATCTTVAEMIKGKAPDEIRRIFNINNQFTPEKEEQIRKESEWVSEK